MSVSWNPWHGCRKISPGCANCYVYRIDEKHGKDAGAVAQTASFALPVKKDRQGRYKISQGETVYTCFTSDFLLEEADGWREQAWEMMRKRQDLHFFFITKRIHRFEGAMPKDWGDGYENVTVGCTVENMDRARYRLPIFLSLPLKRRVIIAEPLLERLDLSPFLSSKIQNVTVGGESGEGARVCDFDWVLEIREACRKAGVDFSFKQTGALFRKNGTLYRIPRKYQHLQAKKAGIDLSFP